MEQGHKVNAVQTWPLSGIGSLRVGSVTPEVTKYYRTSDR